MNLSESYKRRIQELIGLEPKIPEDYLPELKRLGIERFEDLEGATVQYVKPSYGEHTVLKWYPGALEYLLFTDGQKVLAPPQRIKIINKKPIDVNTELKWVITKLCEDKVQSIDIKDVRLNEESAKLEVEFDIICEDFNRMWDKRVDVEVLYAGVILSLEVDNGKLSSYLAEKGKQTILKSSDGDTAGNWSDVAPFIGPNYSTDSSDWGYMAKIIEKIILEMI